MKLQAGLLSSWDKPKTKPGANRLRQRARSLLQRAFWRLTAAVVGFTLAGSCLKAEEQIISTDLQIEPTTSSDFSAYLRSTTFTLRTVSDASEGSVEETFRLVDDRRLNSIFEKPGTGLGTDTSVMLFRKQMPSRYSYRAWAGLRTGFGQFFKNDTFGRSRTNGAGLQYPECLYVKLSLRF